MGRTAPGTCLAAALAALLVVPPASGKPTRAKATPTRGAPKKPKATPAPTPTPLRSALPTPTPLPTMLEGLTGSAKRLAAALRGMQLLAAAEPANVPAFTDINEITPVQWAGAVSAAMEGMRLFLGEMTEEEEGRFEKRWRPLFDHPDMKVLEYCNALNPLLAQFLATRTSLAQASQDFDAAQLEAAAAAGLGDGAGVTEAMEEAAVANGVLRSLQRKLAEVGEAIVKLGEPPDAAAEQQAARRRHKKAFQVLEASPIEGEWELPGGSHVVYKIVRTFDDGLLLVYGGPKTQLEEARRKGISTAKPGMINTEKGGLLIIPGTWDLLEIWEPLGDGRFVTLAVVLVAQITVRTIDEDGNMAARTYTPGNVLNPKPSVGTWSATLIDPSPKEIPLLEGHTWKEMEELARTEGHKKADYYRKYKSQNARDYQDGLRGSESREAKKRRMMEEGIADIRRRVGFERDHRIAQSRLQAAKEPGAHVMSRAEADAWAKNEEARLTAQLEADVERRLDGGAPPSPPAGTKSASDAEAARKKREAAEAEAQAKEQVAFHEANIKYFRDNLASLEKRLAAEKNPDSRSAMERDLLYQKDAIQREEDAITTLKTGEFTRTRTDLDALNQEMMARQGRAEAEKWSTIQRVLQQGPRLIARAPAEEQDQLRDFFYRQLDGKAIASGDPEKFRRVAKVVGDKVTGLLERDAARAEEAAVVASRNLAYVEKVKSVADQSLTVLSFGGGTPVLMAYQGATGYIEGGVGEAVKRTISSYNAATIIANETIEGYQRGVLENLEEYAKDPQKVKLDESRAGWTGAAWGGGEAAAMAALMHLGVKALAGGAAGPEPQGKRPTFQEVVAEHRFRQDQEGGRALVRQFQERMARLAEAGERRATREEILALRREAEQAYRTIKTDFHAKMHLNALGRAGDAKTIHYYQSFERQAMADLRTRFAQRMAADGWSEQQYKTFSNSASKGKVGMDIDLGAVEPPRYVLDKAGNVVRDAKGRPSPNPEHAAWMESLSQRTPGGLSFRRSPQEFQRAGQHHLEEAFKDVYGRPPSQAFVNFTTSFHPEAYRDPAWLGRKGMKTANFSQVDPKWVQQAADVTGFKVNNLPHEHPSFGYYNTLQEQCRGAVKDFDTKLVPLFKDVKNPEAVKHLTELRQVMERFARNEIGPIEADHAIKVLTGGEGMPGVADRFRVMLQGLKGTAR